MRLALRVPAGNERGPAYMDQVLAALHQGNLDGQPLSLEIGLHQGSTTLFIRSPDALIAPVTAALYAQYPDTRLEAAKEHLATDQMDCWRAGLDLRPDVFPIRRYGQFEDALNRVNADPLSALLSALATRANDEIAARIVFTIYPASDRRRHQAERVLRRLARPFFKSHPILAHRYALLACSPSRRSRLFAAFIGWFVRPSGETIHDASLHTSSGRLHEREDDLQAASDKLGRLLFDCRIRLLVTAREGARDQAVRKLRELAGAFGPFQMPRLASFHATRIMQGDSDSRHRGFLLSTEELATLFHPPTETVRAPTMARVDSRELEPPVHLPTPTSHPDVAAIGEATFRGRRQRFGVLPDDRLRHAVVIGKTGMGKSTLLQQLIASDLAAGRGLALVDPHGDLTEAVLRSVPRSRSNDVILFDAADADFPVAFNVLACADPSQRPLLASGILAAFKKLFADSWGPRLEHILRNSLLTLLEVPGSTLVSLLRLLGDARFRQQIVQKISDPVVRGFWQQEFAGMPPKLQAEAISPVQNKVGHFVSSPLLRNIVGQPTNLLDLRQILDEGKVLLVNLSKGRLGDDASGLLGSLLVTALQLAAMSRADVPEDYRRPFFLYVDEFQNFATESFATILSEARKYRLGLTLAHQYLAQLDDATRAAVFGNVGTMVAFQVGADDAEIVAEQLGAEALPPDLLQLPKHTAIIRLLIDGMPSRPFTLRTLPPPTVHRDPGRSEIIRGLSRRRYARPRSQVEDDVERQYTRT